jgi:hypothetical protein
MYCGHGIKCETGRSLLSPRSANSMNITATVSSVENLLQKHEKMPAELNSAGQGER